MGGRVAGGAVDVSLAMSADADRHLLFGLLTSQNGIINQGQLVATFQTWTQPRTEKPRSLDSHARSEF